MRKRAVGTYLGPSRCYVQGVVGTRQQVDHGRWQRREKRLVIVGEQKWEGGELT